MTSEATRMSMTLPCIFKTDAVAVTRRKEKGEEPEMGQDDARWCKRKNTLSLSLFERADRSVKYFKVGREPWSSGYGKRLTFQRSWVRIPAQYTGWTFFTYICCKNCNVCLKRPKINEKEAGVGPFKNYLKRFRTRNDDMIKTKWPIISIFKRQLTSFIWVVDGIVLNIIQQAGSD